MQGIIVKKQIKKKIPKVKLPDKGFSSQKHVFFTKNLLLTGFETKTSLKEKKNDKWKQHED